MIFSISPLRSISLRKAGTIAPARKWIFGIALATTVTVLSAAPPPDWPMFGQNVSNTASTTSPGNSMSPTTIGKLKPKWIFTTGGDVSARAAVVNGVVYFPDWGGNIWAVNANNGHLVWGHQLSDYGLALGTISRTSPAVVGGIVYIGTQYNTSGPTGWLLAIDAGTGNLIWKTQPITSNPFPVITGSPVLANGVVYVPMTSNEEFAAAQGSQSYHCCSVSGSVAAVNAATGAVIWSFNTVPAGYSGGAVWGSNPVLDSARNTVYVGTGNNYSVPTDPA
jgi:polyvinyl alcohol dehydrogenase (cytochrome)